MSTTADLPPEYPKQSGPAEVPPNYSTGSRYVIGGKTLSEPLVRISHVKAHLALLGAIRELRATIEAGRDPRIPKDALGLFPTQRWAWFAGLAVER